MLITYYLKQLLYEITEELAGISCKKSDIRVEHPNDYKNGDLSTNLALQLFGKVKIGQSKDITRGPGFTKTEDVDTRVKTLNYANPRQIASDIVNLLNEKTDPKIFAKIDIAGPGFINFYLSDEFYFDQLTNIVLKKSQIDDLKQQNSDKTVVIDYSAPNIAKRFNIGHLRSTIIGQAIYNFYSYLGWQTIGDNHLGDWGTQFGKMIVAIKKWADKPVDQLTINEMEELYVKFHQEAEQDPSLDDEARLTFKKLEDGAEEEKQMWQTLVNQSMQEFAKLYKILGVDIDYAYGESFYEDLMGEVIQEAQQKGLAEKSQGALIFPFAEEENLPPAMLVKKDGATMYFTRDLATIKFRQQKWSPDLMVYEVGAEQTLHFKQVFKAAHKLGWAKEDQFVHIPHGLIRLKQGKMSTRKGNTVKLEQVLAEAIERAKQFNDDEKTAQQVGVGAVKFNDLKHAPKTGYKFDWNEMITLEGDSGPYLQYSVARAHSLIKKTGLQPLEIVENEIWRTYEPNEDEYAVLQNLYQADEVIIRAAEEFGPHLVCEFLLQLAQNFNRFYNKHRVLEAGTQEALYFRVLLVQAVIEIMSKMLKLLGIETPDEM